MKGPPLIVIFGAAVRPDGQASATLVRRTGYGFQAAREHPQAKLLCSGGAVRPGPTEAAVMAEMLTGWGLPRERLVLDHESVDTLQNCRAAAAVARATGAPFVLACSDAYHLPRILILLRLCGVRAVAWSAPRRHGRPSRAQRLWMRLRECPAILLSLLKLLARPRRMGS